MRRRRLVVTHTAPTDDELIDILDARGRPIGVGSREAVHRDGSWHRVFHCWVVFRDASGSAHVVLQRRGANVRNYPRFLDVSAAGHYQSGEALEEGLRELEEELGIRTTWDSLVPLGVRVNVDDAIDGIRDHELQQLYLLEWSPDPARYVVQREEVDGLVAASTAELLALFAGERPSARGEEWPGDGRPLPDPAPIQVRATDFIATPDDYAFRAVIAMDRYIRGERYLRI